MMENNRQVGHRKQPEITRTSSGSLLRRGCEVNDALHTLPTGNTTYFPKGIYRYQSFKQANQHWLNSIAKGIAQITK